MLPVGDRPLLELIIQRLRSSGIHDVSLTTHYLPDSIVNHFGDGKDFGVHLNYLRENNPMGTAGGLKQMKRPAGPFLVLNGDILTAVPLSRNAGLPSQALRDDHRRRPKVRCAGSFRGRRMRRRAYHEPAGETVP